ncbi:hypothetical protein PRK78_002578 [Emydomyces testavorans]|uniref:Uncharacterized protein n=1 Tax=Emydomyces testavorans TaxID=2070801 RepID=A0AAF0IHP3_9EURO|nr:hypothetical protein PRK78_002578 [Emydomyces testavorans]
MSRRSSSRHRHSSHGSFQSRGTPSYAPNAGPSGHLLPSLHNPSGASHGSHPPSYATDANPGGHLLPALPAPAHARNSVASARGSFVSRGPPSSATHPAGSLGGVHAAGSLRQSQILASLSRGAASLRGSSRWGSRRGSVVPGMGIGRGASGAGMNGPPAHDVELGPVGGSHAGRGVGNVGARPLRFHGVQILRGDGGGGGSSRHRTNCLRIGAWVFGFAIVVSGIVVGIVVGTKKG